MRGSCKQKGFFTMEILLSFTIFVLILLSFQSVFRESIRIQRYLERGSVGLLERSIFEEKMQEDLQFVTPLKDGRMFFVKESPSQLIVRFLSTRRLTVPVQQLSSHVLIIEYEFSKVASSVLLKRKEKSIDGYNETIIENFDKPDFTEDFLPDFYLSAWEASGKRRINWIEHPQSLSFQFSNNQKQSSDQELHRVYPIAKFRATKPDGEVTP